MPAALTTHLPPVDDDTAISVGELVGYILELPGWEHIQGAFDARMNQLQKELLDKSPRDSAAEYERTIGEMRGLRSIEQIIQGLITRAEEANRNGS